MSTPTAALVVSDTSTIVTLPEEETSDDHGTMVAVRVVVQTAEYPFPTIACAGNVSVPTSSSATSIDVLLNALRRAMGAQFEFWLAHDLIVASSSEVYEVSCLLNGRRPSDEQDYVEWGSLKDMLAFRCGIQPAWPESDLARAALRSMDCGPCPLYLLYVYPQNDSTAVCILIVIELRDS